MKTFSLKTLIDGSPQRKHVSESETKSVIKHKIFLNRPPGSRVPLQLVGTVDLCVPKKSRIRDTKDLSTDADSSTDAIGGWTKNTPKPDFFLKQKKSPKTQKLRNI